MTERRRQRGFWPRTIPECQVQPVRASQCWFQSLYARPIDMLEFVGRKAEDRCETTNAGRTGNHGAMGAGLRGLLTVTTWYIVSEWVRYQADVQYLT